MFLDGKEYGPVEVTNMKNLRGDPKEGAEHKPQLDKRGRWNVFKGGIKIGSYDGDTDVSASPGLVDYFFRYTPNQKSENMKSQEDKKQDDKSGEKNKSVTKDSSKKKI